MVPASAGGATPKRFASGAWPKLGPALSCLNQSMKSLMPAWTISPTQERSSALSSANQGRSDSIRLVASVLSRPDALRSFLTARARGLGGRDTPAAYGARGVAGDVMREMRKVGVSAGGTRD